MKLTGTTLLHRRTVRETLFSIWITTVIVILAAAVAVAYFEHPWLLHMSGRR